MNPFTTITSVTEAKEYASKVLGCQNKCERDLQPPGTSDDYDLRDKNLFRE
jgi:hypothetical protein